MVVRPGVMFVEDVEVLVLMVGMIDNEDNVEPGVDVADVDVVAGMRRDGNVRDWLRRVGVKRERME